MGKQQVGKSSSDVRDHTNASNFHLVDPTVPQQEEGLSFYMQLLSMLFGILGIMYRVILAIISQKQSFLFTILC